MRGIVPGKKYTPAEVKAMRGDPQLADLKMQGYVCRADADGTIAFVHWSQSGFAKNGGAVRTPRTYRREIDWDLPPIQRRTPQERMDSLMKKVGEDVKYLLHDDSGEAAKELATEKIEHAHNVYEAAEAKKVVRTAPSE